jgi:hypothetical protein
MLQIILKDASNMRNLELLKGLKPYKKSL